MVVTGGAGGIGRAIAEACAAAGARVAVLDVKHEETASLLEELPGEGHLCVTGDVYKRQVPAFAGGEREQDSSGLRHVPGAA